MAVYKLVFAGPVGAGKTTAVQSLSDIEVVSTESVASDGTRRLKRTTTVAMDYGVMKLDNGDQVHLYGTPGQRRFDFMWDIVCENALGLILMIKGDAVDPRTDLCAYIEEFRELIDKTTLVVGITHTRASDGHILRQLAEQLIELDLPPYVMDVDSRKRSHMAMLVKALIHGIHPLPYTATA